jgi:hypothetical protein
VGHGHREVATEEEVAEAEAAGDLRERERGREGEREVEESMRAGASEWACGWAGVQVFNTCTPVYKTMPNINAPVQMLAY